MQLSNAVKYGELRGLHVGHPHPLQTYIYILHTTNGFGNYNNSSVNNNEPS